MYYWNLRALCTPYSRDALVANLGTKILPLHTYIHTDITYTQTLDPFRSDMTLIAADQAT